MKLTNPVKTIANYLKLSFSHAVGMNFMGSKLEDIFNFLQLSDAIATAGQPTEAQLATIKQAGYQQVINLAPSTAENALTNALTNEGAIVEALGMEYVHIPVWFDNPTLEEFDRFCKTMQTIQSPVFIHCAANMRVSAFIYLYRRVYEQTNAEIAQTDLQKIWTPNETWQRFIDQVMAKHTG